MMRPIFLAGVIFLGACETITVNGVQLDRNQTIAWGLAGIVVASAIYHLADDDESKSDQCKTYSAPPDLKGGEVFCAIPLD